MAMPTLHPPLNTTKPFNTFHSSADNAAKRAGISSAQLTEVFSSYQGEGPYVGERQLFVRFSHCHLKCTYCDTSMSNAHGQCNVIHHDEHQQLITRQVPNPFTPDSFTALLQEEWARAAHKHVSLTGGEPLLYHKLLADVLPELHTTMPMYLETSGTQPDLLAPIAPWLNTVAMDIKLPSATGEQFYIDEHKAFLSVCQAHQLFTFTKLVVNNHVTADELDAVVEIMHPHRNEVTVFIQPESNLTKPGINLNIDKLFAIEETLSKRGLNVRVVPQTHKMLNVL
jgi:organic radical activating enzyme